VANTAMLTPVAQATATYRAVDYNRVSTEEQKRGYGIASGLRRTAAYIERKCWSHVGTYKDEGLSGSLGMGERDDFDRLMADAAKIDAFGRRPFDVVVMPKGDRIGRTGRAFWRWVWALEDIGIFVALVDKDCDNTTAHGRGEFRRVADYAETEWEMIRSRTQDGLQEKAYSGGWTGGQPPFGWLIHLKGKKGESRLAPDEEEVKLVHRVISLLREGKTWRGCAIRLNADGEFARSGRPWTAENLRGRILSEAMLYGYVTFRNVAGNAKKDRDGNLAYGESVRIPAPVFLDASEIAFLKKISGSRQKSKEQASTYSLSGRLIGKCGKHYSGRLDAAGGRRGYRCTGRTEAYPGAPKCSDSEIDADLIETHVWSVICETFSNRAKLEDAAGEWLGMVGVNAEVHAERIADLDRQIESMTASITAVIIASARTQQSPEAIANATAALNGELAQLQSMRAEAASWLDEHDQAAERAASLRDLAENSKERLPLMTLGEQTRFLSLMDITVIVEGDVPTRSGGRRCPVGAWYRNRGIDVPTMTDDLWTLVEPSMPPAGRRGDVRLSTVRAILDKAQSGESWYDVCGRHGASRHTVVDAWRRWEPDGTWALLDGLLTSAERVPAYSDAPGLPLVSIDGFVDPRLGVVSTSSCSQSFPDSLGDGFRFRLDPEGSTVGQYVHVSTSNHMDITHAASPLPVAPTALILTDRSH
jgi:DNA invertase Pin-like site-specific DNA recombinase